MNAHKDKAMTKLETGKTISFSVGILERMNPAKLEQMCRKYRLKAGKPEEMRGRLADLLLAEKKRTNNHLYNKAKGILDTIDKRMEEDLSEMEALWYANDTGDQATKFGMDDRIDALDKVNGYRKGVIGDLDEWHQDFIKHKKIEMDDVPMTGATLSKPSWDKMVGDQHSARPKVRKIFDDLMVQLSEKRSDLLAMSEAVKLKELELKELDVKCAQSKNKTDGVARDHEKLTREKHAAEDGAKAAASEAKEAVEANNHASKHFQDHVVEWERLEEEWRRKVEALKQKHRLELEALLQQYAEEIRAFQAKHDAETKELRDAMQAQSDKLKAEYEAKLAALVADLKAKGKDELNGLTDELMAVELRIAELERQLAAAQQRVSELEDVLAQAEAAATEAEAARDAVFASVVDADIALFRQHHDEFQWWKQNVRGRTFGDQGAQAVEPVKLPEIPRTQAWFKPSEDEADSAMRRPVVQLGPVPGPVEIEQPVLAPMSAFPTRPQNPISVRPPQVPRVRMSPNGPPTPKKNPCVLHLCLHPCGRAKVP
jgi:hypothetical protein